MIDWLKGVRVLEYAVPFNSVQTRRITADLRAEGIKLEASGANRACCNARGWRTP